MLQRMTVPVLLSVSLTLISLFVALPATAQEEQIKKIPPIEEINPLATRINIEFPGGTITEFLQLIEKTNGIKPNVIVSKEAAQVKLPPIQLRSAPLAEAIMAIERLEMIDDVLIRVNETRSVLTVIAYDKKKEQPKSPPFAIESKVFDTSDLVTEKLRIVDIVTAINATWEMLDLPPRKPQLKYHEETKLLIVVGSEKAIVAADNVLRELQEAVSRKNKQSQILREFEQEQTQNLTTIKKLSEENALLKKKLAELEKK
ncbi:MAG: hypothetical protein ABIK28_20670 [Planctomycetota bacterium]